MKALCVENPTMRTPKMQAFLALDGEGFFDHAAGNRKNG